MMFVRAFLNKVHEPYSDTLRFVNFYNSLGFSQHAADLRKVSEYYKLYRERKLLQISTVVSVISE
jgi:hypothetical protein